MAGIADVMTKLDDVLDKINDNKEKIDEIKDTIEVAKYLYTYCDSCNGNGIIEDTGTNPETGQPNPPSTCAQCNGKGKVASGEVFLEEIANSSKMSLSGSSFVED